MAKKKRRTEEKVVFKRPDFDEKDYMRKEMMNAKVGIITFFYGIPYALVSWQLALANLAIFGFLAIIMGILSLRYVYPYFGVDVEEFEKKTWLGNGAVLVLTWLSLWVLLLNPPFSDLATPSISKVQVSGNDGVDWVRVSSERPTNLTLVSTPPDNLAIKAKVTDNVGIERVEIEINSVISYVGAWAGEEDNMFGSRFDMPAPSASVTITAWDDAGHETTYSFDLTFD
jgi:hypothetical protein